MASIFDHRPTTRGAGPGLSPWMGAGLGAAHAKDLRRQAEQDQREADEASRREEEYQQAKRVRDLQIAETERASAEDAATRGAARESMGIRYDGIMDRLTAKQRAGLERWIQNPDVNPEFIERQLDEWGAEQDLADLLEDATELKSYAQSIGADRETGEPGAMADQAQAILDQVSAEELTVEQGKMELRELERGAILEEQAFQQRNEADHAATQMLSELGGSLTPDTENFDRVMDILTDIRSSVVTVKHPDKSRGMVPKDYRTLLTRLEYYLRPDMAQAAAADLAERKQTQGAMRAASPEVYQALRAIGGPEVDPRAFMEAKEAFDLSGMAGLRRQVGLPPAADPARVHDMASTGEEYDMSGFDFPTPPTTGQEEFAAAAPERQETKPLATFDDAQKAEAAANLQHWIAVNLKDKAAEMSGDEFRAAVIKEAKKLGIEATFQEIMDIIPLAGRGPREEVKRINPYPKGTPYHLQR